MHDDSIRAEFTHQTDGFADEKALQAEATLGALVELVPADPEARWLETACGPAVVGRAIAAKVGAVHGVDLTPSMIERGREDAAREGVGNLELGIGDATALPFADDSFDGAATRFSLHHIPAPARVVEEMARVVRPGGFVVVGDHARDEDGAAAAWAEEIERLRDPSHWASLTAERLRVIGAAAGLELDRSEAVPFELGFEIWRDRGSGGEAAAPLIERLLGEAPAAANRPEGAAFQVIGEGEERRLRLRNLLFRWRVR